jgi:CheY-like chemotaxis protein
VARLKLSQSMRAVEDAGLSHQLKEADNALESAISYSRSLVAELTPPVLREFGLTMALTWLAQQMQRNHLRVDLQFTALALEFSEDEAVLMFLSVRELLMNVLKHAQTDRALVSVAVSPEGEREIAVIDRGRGFDLAVAAVEHQGKLDHFGLFSVRERMEALGGRLELVSAAQQGTHAALILPPVGESSVPHAEPCEAGDRLTARRAKGEAPLRVLLVDDHIMVRQGLKSILEVYKDIEVVAEAADGEEAIDLADTYRPDIVVMDINMPKLDGVEATRRIKGRLPSAIVIGLSVQGGIISNMP